MNLSRTMQNSLELDGIRHCFPNGVVALDGVSLGLTPQTFTCIVGASGCGKSTLLRIGAGLLRPTEGQVWLDGQVMTKPNRDIGLAFQDPNLLPWRTVEHNLALPLELAGMKKSEQGARTDQMLAMLGLSEFASVYPTSLSGGMAQRIAIGRALISDPRILLLDEPFGALDALTREQLSSELLRIWEQDCKTVLMITHSIQEAVLLSDRVIVMTPRPGQVAADIAIILPRPRHWGMVTQPEFIDFEAQIREALRI